MPVFYTFIDSPLGPLRLVGDGHALSGLTMSEHRHAPDTKGDWIREDAPFEATRSQLDEYFAGRRSTFDLVTAPAGTAFQQRVWQALQQIPYGQAESYGQLAERIGSPKAARAVGLANGRNPISIVIPCHRVIGAGGQLTGYGGGLERKRWLLDHETQNRSVARDAVS
ncbi:methylated-DNA--[protein]-cysteine S-methyltransferase [Salinisphaera sp. T31B1]|uniref:methylated-DNA--[protein]-cysteine S-methyltransferase n=1 Tax=Salinisphaera sp. T31B1 TaxID=727963 RepID=UPI0033413E1C